MDSVELRVNDKAQVSSVEKLTADFANCDALDEADRAFEARADWPLAGLLVAVVEIESNGTAQIQVAHSASSELEPVVVRAGWETYRAGAIDLAKAHVDGFPASGGPGETLRHTHGLGFDEALDDLQEEEGGGYGFSPEGKVHTRCRRVLGILRGEVHLSSGTTCAAVDVEPRGNGALGISRRVGSVSTSEYQPQSRLEGWWRGPCCEDE